MDSLTGGPAWHERAASPALADESISAGGPSRAGGEIEAIILRGARLGIPAWRITTALGVPPSGAAGN